MDILERNTNLPIIEFGRDICNSEQAIQKEWLLTNGIGGYASGTIAGSLTRRYHGYLIAALNPPLGRTQLLTKLDEVATYNQGTYHLFTDFRSNKRLVSNGFQYIERFRLVGTNPIWDFRIADALLTKKIWMEPGENISYIKYSMLTGSFPVALSIKTIINFRKHHNSSHRSGIQFDIFAANDFFKINAQNLGSFWLYAKGAQNKITGEWFRDYYYTIEAYRGIEALDDHYYALLHTFSLQPGESFTIVASHKEITNFDFDLALQKRIDFELDIINHINSTTNPSFLPLKHTVQYAQLMKRLSLAADQFIVNRPTGSDPSGKTIIAGYPWFSDWGRDTMISLHGLTLCTKRYDIARKILQTFSEYIDKGMIPNRFPSAESLPEYNTVDATLWFFNAIYEYLQRTHDLAFLESIYSQLENIIDWHLQGTRYNIKVDQSDGLIYAGAAGVQLTWMDAKVSNWVVTPRIGKPVEINALWFNALKIMQLFAHKLGLPYMDFRDLTNQVSRSFQKYWEPNLGYLYDVIDSPNGDDRSLRPNQIFTISLPFSPLYDFQKKSILRKCAQYLYTSMGLRSVAPQDFAYIGRYGGNQVQRDAAYHQGTVWGWLLGPFVTAWYRAFNDLEGAFTFLNPIFLQLTDHCIGNISEIFDGDPPHQARGCFAQAWSIAETLRAIDVLSNDVISEDDFYNFS